MQFSPQERQLYERYLAMMRQTRVDHNAGRYREAASGDEQVTDWARQLFGEKSSDYALALNNLAAVYQDLKKLEESLPIQLDALDRLREHYGQRHPYVITAVSNVAGIYKVKGNLPLAAKWKEEAVALARDPETGKDKIDLICALSLIYNSMGRLEDAKELLRHANSQLASDQKSGLDYVDDQVSVYGAIASLQTAQGDYVRAIAANRFCLQAIERAYGPETTLAAVAISNLGVAWLAVGDVDRARDLLAKAPGDRPETGRRRTPFVCGR